jgi:hypothetical protein
MKKTGKTMDNQEETIDMSQGMLDSIHDDVLGARNLLNRMLEKAARNGIVVYVALFPSVLGCLVNVQVKDYKASDIPCIELVNAASSLLNEMILLAFSRKIEIETRLVPILHLNPRKKGLREHLAVEALPKENK